MKTTPLAGLLVIEQRILRDSRGFFIERYKESNLAKLGITEKFPQDNHSRSAPGILRGMHFQTNPQQGKLVSVIRGAVWDAVVDLRKGSPTFGKSWGLELSDQNGLALWIPYGFAHGFCVLGNSEADLYYKVTGEFNAATEGGIRWDDHQAAVDWPIKNPIVSERDQKLPLISEIQPL